MIVSYLNIVIEIFQQRRKRRPINHVQVFSLAKAILVMGSGGGGGGVLPEKQVLGPSVGVSKCQHRCCVFYAFDTQVCSVLTQVWLGI